jgi:hypothetical protein
MIELRQSYKNPLLFDNAVMDNFILRLFTDVTQAA